MGTILLATLILGTGLAALTRPWIGICSYYLLSILGPQYIWWWNFEGLRVSLVVAVCTLAGVSLKLLAKKYSTDCLFNRHNFWLAALWLFLTCSYFFGPYVPLYSSSGLRPEQIFSITNSIFIFYFCAVLEMDELYKIRYLSIIFVASTIYMIYWANAQYFDYNWTQFNQGRLMGPKSPYGSIYRDENAFAMLFVTGLPFVYYLGFEIKTSWRRYLLWATIPLGWHAIFLTASRGGFLGLGIVILVSMLLSKRKTVAVPLLVAFFIFYNWQAGDVMKRRSETIVVGESSSDMRLAAWKGGLGMIMKHPVTGVGMGAFITALPVFSSTSPRVAHNTLVQFTAESGLGAGAAYLFVLGLFVVNARKVRAYCREHDDPESLSLARLNDASSASFAGLVTCSLFLSLNTYEIFFVLLIFNNALLRICRQKSASVGQTDAVEVA